MGQGAGEKGAVRAAAGCQETTSLWLWAARQLILIVPEMMLCKGSSAIPRSICTINYISCLDSNSFRFSSYTLSRIHATSEAKVEQYAKIHSHQSCYWRTRRLFMVFHITEYLSQLQLWAF